MTTGCIINAGLSTREASPPCLAVLLLRISRQLLPLVPEEFFTSLLSGGKRATQLTLASLKARILCHSGSSLGEKPHSSFEHRDLTIKNCRLGTESLARVKRGLQGLKGGGSYHLGPRKSRKKAASLKLRGEGALSVQGGRAGRLVLMSWAGAR